MHPDKLPSTNFIIILFLFIYGFSHVVHFLKYFQNYSQI